MNLHLLSLAALLLTACAGQPVAIWPTDRPAVVTLPLVESFEPRRLLVEVQLEGRGPFLFVVDTATEGFAVTREVAEQLGLKRSGDLSRGKGYTRIAHLGLGDLVLTEVRAKEVSWSASEAFESRSIDGVLGMGLVQGGALEVDQGAGVVRLLSPEVPPPLGSALPLVSSEDGLPWVKATLGDKTEATLALATGATGSVLAPDIAKEAALVRHEGAIETWVGHLALGPVRRDLRFATSPSRQADGVLGLDALRGVSFRLEADQLWLWEAKDGTRLTRFGPLTDCGPDYGDCVFGRLESAVPGEVTLVFDPPRRLLPPGLWARVDYGLPGRPKTALIRLGVKAKKPIRLVVKEPGLDPLALRGPDEPVTLVDLVPLDAACGGELCVRRE